MMGAGKSTVGRLVARRLGWAFVDLDSEVEQRAGMSVADVFAQRGEAGFRSLESECLAARLADGAGHDPGSAGHEGAHGAATVVAVGGGAVLDAGNRARIAGAGTVVWLRARPGTLAARLGAGTGRPLLEGSGRGVVGRLAELAFDRGPLYEEVAGAVVDVDGLTDEEVADRLCALALAER